MCYGGVPPLGAHYHQDIRTAPLLLLKPASTEVILRIGPKGRGMDAELPMLHLTNAFNAPQKLRRGTRLLRATASFSCESDYAGII
jgi:hypothetical protein